MQTNFNEELIKCLTGGEVYVHTLVAHNSVFAKIKRSYR
jgi:hypothetical protein